MADGDVALAVSDLAAEANDFSLYGRAATAILRHSAPLVGVS